MLRIAIPSAGRIKSESLSLLDKVGVRISGVEDGVLLARSLNFPAEVFFVDTMQTAKIVMDGLVDACICNELLMRQYGIAEDCAERRLGFDKSSLSLLIPLGVKYEGLRWFNNKAVATPYPEIISSFFKVNNIKAAVRRMDDGLYRCVSTGLADAVFGKVSSGSVMLNEHMREVEKVMFSEAVFMVAPSIDSVKRLIVDELLVRIDSVIAASTKKYVTMCVPADKVEHVAKLLNLNSIFSVVPTATGDSAVNLTAIMDRTRLWDSIEELRALGVHDIVACPVDNLIL